MRGTWAFLGGVVLLGLLAPPLASQNPPLVPGSRLRVSRPQQLALVGTAVRWTPDSLWIALPGQTLPTAVPLLGNKFEVSRGRRSRVVPGALIGLAVGAAVTTGFLAGFCGGDTLCDGDEQVRAAAIFGLPSVALGAGIGLLVRRESWKAVDSSTFERGPGSGRLMVGATLRW